jgi:hypothetical protein
LSLVKIHILGADAFAKAEGNMDGRVNASVWTARRGRRTTAEKSVNKVELSAAELMERRAGAKGNVDQQNTCRAQNRESVSQALERIRQAARHRKRFTSLLNHVSVDLLRLAFFELKRNAAPGVDGCLVHGRVF